MGDLSHEQSMEEILSSIKRIIAEDSEATLSPPRAKRAVNGAAAPTARSAPETEVLELTDTAPPEVEPVAVAVSEASPQPEIFAMPEPLPDTVVLPVGVFAPDEPEKPALVSNETVSASRSAIAALSALVVKPEVNGSDTLEGLVREMLKPVLSEWLDARLPDIVERLVAQEIRRITERG